MRALRVVAGIAVLAVVGCTGSATPVPSGATPTTSPAPAATPTRAPVPATTPPLTPSPSPSEAPRIPIEGFETLPNGGCDSIGIAAPVLGTVVGDASDPSVVWLEDLQAGTRLEIVWPSGFYAQFAPTLELYDGIDRLVARSGDRMVLQVERAVARGTVDDPYFATGLMVVGPLLNPDDSFEGATYVECFVRAR